MKRGKHKFSPVITVLVIAAFIFQPALALAGDYDEGYAAGEAKGKEYMTDKKSGWIVGTLILTPVFGLIPLATAYSNKPKKKADIYIEEGVSEEYKMGFVEGFCKIVKKERIESASLGYFISMALWLVIITSIISEQKEK